MGGVDLVTETEAVTEVLHPAALVIVTVYCPGAVTETDDVLDERLPAGPDQL